MIRLLTLFLLLPVVLVASPRRLVLAGTLTNTSAGDVSAAARLELVIEGEKATARLVTEKPLTGTGELTGRIAGGWLELGGVAGDGLRIKFRGGLSPVDYRGTYVAAVEGQLVQYGRFELVIEGGGKTPGP